VNLGRVLKHFITQELIEPCGIPWNVDVFRPNGKVIKLTFWGATVTCDTTQRYSTLQAFYKACEQPELYGRRQTISHKLFSFLIYCHKKEEICLWM
jgi:hypothetical protein